MKSPGQSRISVIASSQRSRQSLCSYDSQITWEETKESKRRKRKLEQLWAVESTMKEVPTINSNSRRKAEKLLSKSQRSLLNIKVPEEAVTEYLHNHLLFKNSLKRMGSSGPMNLDVHLTKSELKLAVQPKRKAKTEITETDLDPHYEQLRQLKGRMDSLQGFNNSYCSRNDNFSVRLSIPETTQIVEVLDSQDNDLIINSKYEQTNTDISLSIDRKKYTPIAPTKARLAYAEGLDSEKFKRGSHPVINYKLL